jgi:hypothetical protein
MLDNVIRQIPLPDRHFCISRKLLAEGHRDLGFPGCTRLAGGADWYVLPYSARRSFDSAQFDVQSQHAYSKVSKFRQLVLEVL